MDENRTQQTRPDCARLGFGSRQLAAVVDRIFLGPGVLRRPARPRLLRRGVGALRFGCSCAGVGSFAFLAGASAQNVPPPPMDLSGTNQLAQSPSTGTSVLAAPPQAPLPDQPVLQLGPVKFYPHFLYRFLYGDGIPATANEKLRTAINEVYPGLLFQVGSHWQLDYTPSLHYYSNSHFRDTTDQSVVLTGGTAYGNWTLGLSQAYATTSQPLIETRAQTEFETYGTGINAAYQFNAEASLSLGINQQFLFEGQNSASEQLVDMKTWSTMDWFDYRFWPKFSAGLGVGGGYTELSPGSPMSNEQLQGRISWQVRDKLSLTASVGVEDMQILEGKVPDLINPIFGASIVYRPFENTSLSLNAGRLVMPSFFLNQVIENTYVSLTFHQRLLKKLDFDLTGSYRNSSYLDTGPALASGRQDDYTSVTARLSVPFLKRGAVGVFYQALQDISKVPTVAQYQLSSTQVGFDLGYHF